MKKTYLILLITLLQLVTTTAVAQPAAVKKAAASVFALTTFKADGSIHGSGYGVFVGPAGEAVAMWHPFDGAARAVVVDAKGRSHEVDVMLGMSEIYDVCHFRIKDGSAMGLALATADTPEPSTYLVGYDIKKPTFSTLKPLRTEKFMDTNNYYVFNDNDVSNTDLGLPLVNDRGELLGIMQRPRNGGQAHSADARLIKSFTRSGLSINDQSMRATGIRAALPTDEQQAMLMLMLAASQADSARYEAYIADFIGLFPTSTEGYKRRGELFVQRQNLAQADQTFEQEVKNATAKDEAYYDYAQAVYRAVAFRIDTTFAKWSYARAMELATQAHRAKPLPIYRHLQAQITYAQGQYQQALDMFTALQQTELGKNGEVYYEAAQCKTRLGAPRDEIVQLLDAAVNAQQGPAAAPYVLARGLSHDNAGEYRKAFADYLAYDTLMNNRASHDFYYTKFRCEMKIRQYQLALNDIAHAIVLNRTEPTYYAEMANLQLQVKQLDEAIATCNMGLQVASEYSDLYIIKGIAQCENNDRTNGLATLQKARELGDDRAEALIAKYEKH